MRNLFLALVAGALFSLGTLLWPAPSSASELDTTWRVGDRVTYQGACHSPDDMVEVLMTDTLEEGRRTFSEFIREKSCIFLIMPFSAKLTRYITGPFDGDGEGTPVSIWEVFDAAGDTEYIGLIDSKGPHKSISHTI